MDKKIFSENCNLSSYTTIKVGGVAEYFAEPRSIEEFSYLIKWANLNKHRCQIIGAGSNLLINNIFIKGLVVCTKKLKSLKIEPYSGIVEAEAGVMLPTLSNSLAKNKLQGGEWAVGIPGTLGGAIYMNAGTGNLSLAKNLISVKVINNKTHEKLEIEKKDINFVFLNVDNQKWGNYIQKFAVNGIPQVNLFDKKGNLISTFIGKQDEMKIRKSINDLEKEEKPYEEIINAEFSTIQENKNNEVNPRSHG